MLVRPAIVTPGEAAQIVTAYHLYLQSIAQFETELAPTLGNATRFAETVLIPAWQKGEPILFAVLNNRCIGATFTTLPDPGFEYRVPYALGHGTWVREEWRGHGVARLLIERVRAMLRAIGIHRQLGMAHEGHEASRKVFHKLGFRRHGTVLRCDL